MLGGYTAAQRREFVRKMIIGAGEECVCSFIAFFKCKFIYLAF